MDALYRHSGARHPRHCESRSDVAIHAFAGPQWIASFLAMTELERDDGHGVRRRTGCEGKGWTRCTVIAGRATPVIASRAATWQSMCPC